MELKSISKQFLVKPHRPWRGAAIIVVTGLVMLGTARFTYELGKRHGGAETEDSTQLIKALETRIGSLEARSATLVENNALLRRSASIDRESHAEIKQTLAETQTQMVKLKEELTFYRTLVTPNKGEPHLTLKSVELLPATENATYDYRVMLAQIRKNDRFASGKLNLSVHGVLDGKPRTLRLTDIADVKQVPIKFKFKYFQTFEGRLELLPGFLPEVVEVSIQPTSKHLKPINQSFKWTSILVKGA